MTQAEREEMAVKILVNECGASHLDAMHIARWYANVMYLDEPDCILARGMLRCYEEGLENGFTNGLEACGEW